MDSWGTAWRHPVNHSGSESYQFALGSLMGQTVTELRNMHLGTVTELRSLRTETVTELRALREHVSTATHIIHQILQEEKNPKGAIMAQVSTLLKLLLPYAVLAMVVAGKVTWKDIFPIVRTYLQSLGVF